MKTIWKRPLALALTVAMVLGMGSVSAYGEIPEVCPHHVHDDTCGYSEGTPCSHVCSEESGCIVDGVTNCVHVHDDACGYSEGTPCNFDPADCPECAALNQPEEEQDGASFEATIETGMTFEDVKIGDNDELMRDYLEQMLYGNRGIMLFGAWGEEENVLNAAEQALYGNLKTFIKNVAGGTKASTEDYAYSPSELSFTYEELGLGDSPSADEIRPALSTRFADKLNVSKVVNCLLTDCPATFYWYDKSYDEGDTKALTYGYSISYGTGGPVQIMSMKFSFVVAEGYRSGDDLYTVDTTKISAAKTAIAKAQDIVDSNAGKSDYEKLKAYKEEICSLVSYNEEAATGGNTAYGDPWQIIYVFDEDPETNVVCEGYAKAFQYLCDLSTFTDADCYTVYGTMTSGTGAGEHMWNIVRIGGSSYLVDVTNSDTGSVGADGELFLAGTSGDVTAGYTFTAGGKSITYKYDGEILSDFNRSILTLAAESYDPDAGSTEPDPDVPDAIVSPEPNAKGWHNSEVYLDPPDGYLISDNIDEDFADTTLTVNATVDEATGTYTYYLKKEGGTGEVVTKTIELKIDKNKPEIESVTPSNVTGTTATVTVTANDTCAGIDETSYRLTQKEGSGLTITQVPENSGVFQISGMTPGTEYTFTAEVSDNAGNTQTQDVTVTTIVPDATVSPEPNENGWCNSDVTLTPPKSYKISTSENGPFEETIMISGETGTEGETHTYYLQKADGSGNVITRTINLKIDTTAPIISNIEVNVKGKEITFTITASDAGSGIVEYKATPTGDSNRFDITSSAEPTLTVTAQQENSNCSYKITVTDAAGNTSSEEGTVRIVSDGIQATMTPENPDGSNGWYKSTVTLTAPEGYEISESEDGPYQEEIRCSNYKKGTYIYYIRSEGSEDAEMVTLYGFGVDTTAPTINETLEFYSGDNADTAVVRVTATDDTSGISGPTYTLTPRDGNIQVSQTEDSYLFSISGMEPNTEYKFEAKVSDTAGNETTEEVTFTSKKGKLTASSAPTLSGTYGASLAEMVTAGTTGVTVTYQGRTVDGTWAIADFGVDAETTYPVVGDTTQYTLKFTPANADDQQKYEELIYELTPQVAPAVLTIDSVTVAGKTYDGTETATVTGVTFDGLVLGETSENIYDATAAFADANAGTNKDVTVTVALKDTVKNYTLPNGTFVVTADISQADCVGESIQDSLTVKNNYADTYTYSLSQLLPALEEGKSFGTVSYTLGTVDIPGGYYTENTAKIDNDTLTLPILAASGTEGKIGTVTITIHSTNYADITATLTVNCVDREMPTGTPVLSTSTLTYGDTLNKITLSGTMMANEKVVPGSFAWDDPNAQPNAGTYPAFWTFTPEDEDTYAEVKGSVDITVLKVTPEGDPSYTTIKGSGYTLKDANLTKGTISVDGTISWDLPESTAVAANTSYGWTFTPADTINYNGLTGSIQLWSKASSSSSSGGSDSDTTTTTTTTSDGDTITTVTEPDGTETETVEEKDGTTIVTTTKPDGTKTVVTTETDGTKTTEVTDQDKNVTTTTEYPDGSEKKVVEQENGTVITTEKDKNGNKTEVTEYNDGSVKTVVDNANGTYSETMQDEDGNVTSEVKLTAGVIRKAEENGTPLALPMPELPLTDDKENAPVLTVSMPDGTAAQVEIPMEDTTAGTVVVKVDENGTETVIKTSQTTEDGVVVTLQDGDTVKVVDNSKDFYDVPDSYWGSEAVKFVSSRELFAGTAEHTFSPEGSMTRAMVWTVLARLDGVATGGGANWYAAGQSWAVQNGISDGSDLNGQVSREQLAAMLYRYAQLKGYDTSARADLSKYTDVNGISAYAVEAMQWANAMGIVNGTSATTLDAGKDSTRAQVATMLMNFCNYVVK